MLIDMEDAERAETVLTEALQVGSSELAFKLLSKALEAQERLEEALDVLRVRFRLRLGPCACRLF